MRPKKRGRGSAAQKSLRQGGPEGVCKGCGGATRWRKGSRDSIHWHSRCYQRLYRRRTRNWPWSEKRRCVVCGKPFLAKGAGGFHKKTCSPACSRRNTLAVIRAWDERHGRKRKFTAILREGVCLGCGRATRRGRKSYGRKDSIRWHHACYQRARRLRPDVKR
jgi:hypothetical protein